MRCDGTTIFWITQVRHQLVENYKQYSGEKKKAKISGLRNIKETRSRGLSKYFVSDSKKKNSFWIGK